MTNRGANNLLYGGRHHRQLPRSLRGTYSQSRAEWLLSQIERGVIDEALGEICRCRRGRPNRAVRLVGTALGRRWAEQPLAARGLLLDYLGSCLDNHSPGLDPLIISWVEQMSLVIADRPEGSAAIFNDDEIALLLSSSHPLLRRLYQRWVESCPDQVYLSGVAGDNHLTSDQRRQLRNDCWPAVLATDCQHNLSLSLRTAIVGGQALIEDLADGNPGSEVIAEALIINCALNGLNSLLDVELSDGQARLLLDALDSDGRKRAEEALTGYARTAAVEAARNSASYLNLALSEADLAVRDREARRLAEQLVEARLEGRYYHLVDQWQQLWAVTVARMIDPQMLISGQWLARYDSSGAIIVRPQYLDRFVNHYLKRRLLPDRKLSLSQEEWRQLLRSSLYSMPGRPLDINLDNERLLNRLAAVYNRRRARYRPEL